MATTVHLPPELLDIVDHRAGELDMSRNRFIILALEKAIDEQMDWSPSFLEALTAAAKDSGSHQAIEQMIDAIATKRTRKSRPSL
jgi:predicted transcriptional regulator